MYKMLSYFKFVIQKNMYLMNWKTPNCTATKIDCHQNKERTESDEIEILLKSSDQFQSEHRWEVAGAFHSVARI